ncbi:DsbA family oxidoreductase [Alterisphingorhabdus coralli]|uniref:DsbA family oxidoreductase n=1 Tax=Alterisphingorhabdus coralli TaxID=3071408 RepID=A0AA97F687_9SPHN|nr:DsbA family oxidoreductase [Parasphingorhabdus sp. SCSIO 66989]WOE74981.1 DsbA family oxidoreductase [Parasphingorhabdus sp. SCSIO 66989]
MTALYKMRIDIVSDVVCPWCIIGYKQLENALEMVGDEVEAEIVWQPFELNPHMPPEGQDMAEHVAQKYGTTPEQSAKTRGHMMGLAEKLGFPFSNAPGKRIYNTFKAHQLLHWAGESFGSTLQTRLKLAFFEAYFQENQDVSDEDVLLRAVEGTGLDPDAARAVLNDLVQAERTREALNGWVERGVSGVPATILDGKYMVPGAQDAETFAQMIRKVIAKEAA